MRYSFLCEDGTPAWIKSVGDAWFLYSSNKAASISKEHAETIMRNHEPVYLDRVYVRITRALHSAKFHKYIAPKPKERKQIFRPPYRKPWERDNTTTCKVPLQTGKVFCPFKGADHIFARADQEEEEWFGDFFSDRCR